MHVNGYPTRQTVIMKRNTQAYKGLMKPPVIPLQDPRKWHPSGVSKHRYWPLKQEQAMESKIVWQSIAHWIDDKRQKSILIGLFLFLVTRRLSLTFPAHIYWKGISYPSITAFSSLLHKQSLNKGFLSELEKRVGSDLSCIDHSKSKGGKWPGT